MANFTDDSEVRCKSAEAIFALELSPLLSRLRRRCCEPYSARVSCACSGMPTRAVQSRRGASRRGRTIVSRRGGKLGSYGRTSGDECSIGGGRGSGGGDGYRARGRARGTDGTVAPRAAPDSDHQSGRCDF